MNDIFFLRDAPAELREEFAHLTVARSYPKGNILYHDGDAASMMYVVVHGRVKICLTHEEGREVVLTVLQDGGILGLVAALDGEAHRVPGLALLELLEQIFDRRQRLAVDRGDDVALNHAAVRSSLERPEPRFLRRAVGEHADDGDTLGQLERFLHCLYGAVDPGTVAAGLGEENTLAAPIGGVSATGHLAIVRSPVGWSG